MKRAWKAREGVSPVIATILMVAITVVLAAVLYVMVSGYIQDRSPGQIMGSLTEDVGSTPNVGNATLTMTIASPSNPSTESIRARIFDAGNNEVVGADLTWKHVASEATDAYYKSGDKLQISQWPLDLGGYTVVVTVEGYSGTISHTFE